MADKLDAIRAGCAEAKWTSNTRLASKRDAIRAGCAEAKLPFCARINMDYDAIRAGCFKTNGRSLCSNDHAQNNELNEKRELPDSIIESDSSLL